jgi:osmoprotectant transport system permease protein
MTSRLIYGRYAMAKPLRTWGLTTLYGITLIWWLADTARIKSLLIGVFGVGSPLVERTPLHELVLQHLILVVWATGAAILVGFGLGLLVRLSRSHELDALVMRFGALGETIPSAAVIALSVPLLGYGNEPILLALFLYAILPIVRNTISGFHSISADIAEAAKGMGYTPFQQVLRVELPLALPTVIAGIRTALIINISAATLGATVGAGGLGVPIIAGIRTSDPVMVIIGSVPVILMALAADRVLRSV